MVTDQQLVSSPLNHLSDLLSVGLVLFSFFLLLLLLVVKEKK